MDKQQAIDIAKRFSEAAKLSFPVEKIILFGSHAKGTAHSDSDLDIAVIIKDESDKQSVDLGLWKLGFKLDSRIEPYTIFHSDFDPASPLVFEIQKFGITV